MVPIFVPSYYVKPQLLAFIDNFVMIYFEIDAFSQDEGGMSRNIDKRCVYVKEEVYE